MGEALISRRGGKTASTNLSAVKYYVNTDGLQITNTATVPKVTFKFSEQQITDNFVAVVRCGNDYCGAFITTIGDEVTAPTTENNTSVTFWFEPYNGGIGFFAKTTTKSITTNLEVICGFF